MPGVEVNAVFAAVGTDVGPVKTQGFIFPLLVVHGHAVLPKGYGVDPASRVETVLLSLIIDLKEEREDVRCWKADANRKEYASQEARLIFSVDQSGNCKCAHDREEDDRPYPALL